MGELSVETVYFPRTNLTLDFQFLKQIQFYPGEFPSSDSLIQSGAGSRLTETTAGATAVISSKQQLFKISNSSL